MDKPLDTLDYFNDHATVLFKQNQFLLKLAEMRSYWFYYILTSKDLIFYGQKSPRRLLLTLQNSTKCLLSHKSIL